MLGQLTLNDVKMALYNLIVRPRHHITDAVPLLAEKLRVYVSQLKF